MIIVIDYGIGNIGSILNMLKKIRAPAQATASPAEIETADKIILPGVGAFYRAMHNLNKLGLVGPLSRRVVERGVQILGICLGMHLSGERSEEGKLPGFGWLDGEVKKFRFEEADAMLKIPHMGWNTISAKKLSPLMDGLEDN